MDKYFYPIPKAKLINRFAPVFSQLAKTRNSTLLALPFTGRSSHLRFISSQSKLIQELGLSSSDKFIWLETETCKNLVDIFREICLKIDPSLIKSPIFISQDEYLLFNLLKQTITDQNQNLIIGLTVHKDRVVLVSDIEKQITLLLKHCQHLKVLWSIDSVIYRNYISGHPSCPIFENISYFPTFDQEETLYSLRRTSTNRQKSLSSKLLDQAMNLTGGIAGLFHRFIYDGETYLKTSQAEEIVRLVSSEVTLSPEISQFLSTSECRAFLVNQSNQSFSYGPLKLASIPSAQEVALLRLLLDQLNKPLSRDQIADVLWGKLASQKYSDWAIDKSISRLRDNLKSKTHQLITIKGVGYSLICLENSVNG